MARWCPLTREPCMGATCAWACPGGCAVAVLAGGAVPTPPGPPRRDPRDAANDDFQGRYVERGAWRPIDYEV